MQASNLLAYGIVAIYFISCYQILFGGLRKTLTEKDTEGQGVFSSKNTLMLVSGLIVIGSALLRNIQMFEAGQMVANEAVAPWEVGILTAGGLPKIVAEAADKIGKSE